jgi:hypothetical protein
LGTRLNALGWVQKDTIILEFGEEGAEVLVVPFRESAKYKDVI